VCSPQGWTRLSAGDELFVVGRLEAIDRFATGLGDTGTAAPAAAGGDDD
jgi:Trk K+ transport system NAD-binding subunit